MHIEGALVEGKFNSIELNLEFLKKITTFSLAVPTNWKAWLDSETY